MAWLKESSLLLIHGQHIMLKTGLRQVMGGHAQDMGESRLSITVLVGAPEPGKVVCGGLETLL